jgi:hypothetical protein
MEFFSINEFHIIVNLSIIMLEIEVQNLLQLNVLTFIELDLF